MCGNKQSQKGYVYFESVVALFLLIVILNPFILFVGQSQLNLSAIQKEVEAWQALNYKWQRRFLKVEDKDQYCLVKGCYDVEFTKVGELGNGAVLVEIQISSE